LCLPFHDVTKESCILLYQIEDELNLR